MPKLLKVCLSNNFNHHPGVYDNSLEIHPYFQNVCTNKMKKKLITYFILTSYLALFVANIFHYHSINFNNKITDEFSEQSRNSYSLLDHSSLKCPVHSTFNNLHKFHSTWFQNSAELLLTDEEFTLTPFTFFQPLFFYNTFSLRAPPKLLA